MGTCFGCRSNIERELAELHDANGGVDFSTEEQQCYLISGWMRSNLHFAVKDNILNQLSDIICIYYFINDKKIQGWYMEKPNKYIAINHYTQTCYNFAANKNSRRVSMQATFSKGIHHWTLHLTKSVESENNFSICMWRKKNKTKDVNQAINTVRKNQTIKLYVDLNDGIVIIKLVERNVISKHKITLNQTYNIGVYISANQTVKIASYHNIPEYVMTINKSSTLNTLLYCADLHLDIHKKYTYCQAAIDKFGAVKTPLYSKILQKCYVFCIQYHTKQSNDISKYFYYQGLINNQNVLNINEETLQKCYPFCINYLFKQKQYEQTLEYILRIENNNFQRLKEIQTAVIGLIKQFMQSNNNNKSAEGIMFKQRVLMAGFARQNNVGMHRFPVDLINVVVLFCDSNDFKIKWLFQYLLDENIVANQLASYAAEVVYKTDPTLMLKYYELEYKSIQSLGNVVLCPICKRYMTADHLKIAECCFYCKTWKNTMYGHRSCRSDRNLCVNCCHTKANNPDEITIKMRTLLETMGTLYHRNNDKKRALEMFNKSRALISPQTDKIILMFPRK